MTNPGQIDTVKGFVSRRMFIAVSVFVALIITYEVVMRDGAVTEFLTFWASWAALYYGKRGLENTVGKGD